MKFIFIIMLLVSSINGIGQSKATFDGELKVIPPFKTLNYLIISNELKNNPKLSLYKNKSDSLIYSIDIPPSDTTIVDFGQLNLKKGLYNFRIKDNKGAILEQSFVVGAKFNEFGQIETEDCSKCDSIFFRRLFSNRTSVRIKNCYYLDGKLCSQTKTVKKSKKIAGIGERWGWALKRRRSTTKYYDRSGKVINKLKNK